MHNMLRGMRDQADNHSQSDLYRVRLKPTVVLREGWLIDPSNWLGGVVLDELCPEGVDVARYLNYHEDPGGLSLALGRGAIGGVQQLAVSLTAAWDADWVCDTVAALDDDSDAVVPATGKLARFLPPSSPRDVMGREFGATLADRLPVNLRDQLASAAALAEGEDPEQWARRTSGPCDLLAEPDRVRLALSDQQRREV